MTPDEIYGFQIRYEKWGMECVTLIINWKYELIHNFNIYYDFPSQ